MEESRFCEVIENLKREVGENQAYIFGAGTHGKNLARLFIKENINYYGFLETKPSHKIVFDKKIYGLDDIRFNGDEIIIISLSPLIYREDISNIENILKDKGVREENIIKISFNIEFMDELVKYVNDVELCLDRNKILKDIFKGKRCFVIGNGPSLSLDDLEKLKNEVTFGCNNIINLFDKTDWRPTCFFCEDSIFTQKHFSNKQQISYILDNCKYVMTSLRNDVYKNYGLTFENLYYYLGKRLNDTFEFSEDISKIVYSAGTTLYSILQFAVYMGFKEIYLLGVDSIFKKEILKNGKIRINDVKNHMQLMNQEDGKGVYYIDMIEEAFKYAKKYAKIRGFHIYNATRGGKLEVFKRVNLDDILEGTIQ